MYLVLFILIVLLVIAFFLPADGLPKNPTPIGRLAFNQRVQKQPVSHARVHSRGHEHAFQPDEVNLDAALKPFQRDPIGDEEMVTMPVRREYPTFE